MTALRVGTVARLWRYPVKSLGGEPRTELELESRGIVGDRRYAVRDEAGRFGSGKTTRRFIRMDGLLALQASLADGVPVVRFPDGTAVRGDEPSIHSRLSRVVGRSVDLAREEAVSHFDAGAVHLLTTAGLAETAAALPGATIDDRRFRPNVVIAVDGGSCPLEAWRGRTLAIGAARLRILERTERCAMVGMAQPSLPDDPGVLAWLARHKNGRFGVYAAVAVPGRLGLGDPCWLS